LTLSIIVAECKSMAKDCQTSFYTGGAGLLAGLASTFPPTGGKVGLGFQVCPFALPLFRERGVKGLKRSRDHAELTGAEMPALDVGADDVVEQIDAICGGSIRRRRHELRVTRWFEQSRPARRPPSSATCLGGVLSGVLAAVARQAEHLVRVALVGLSSSFAGG
jgi:hypothetical protein